jgi:hypothetical protein
VKVMLSPDERKISCDDATLPDEDVEAVVGEAVDAVIEQTVTTSSPADVPQLSPHAVQRLQESTATAEAGSKAQPEIATVEDLGALEHLTAIEAVPELEIPLNGGPTVKCGCGNVYMDDALFCRHCGMHRPGAPEPEAEPEVELEAAIVLAPLKKTADLAPLAVETEVEAESDTEVEPEVEPEAEPEAEAEPVAAAAQSVLATLQPPGLAPLDPPGLAPLEPLEPDLGPAIVETEGERTRRLVREDRERKVRERHEEQAKKKSEIAARRAEAEAKMDATRKAAEEARRRQDLKVRLKEMKVEAKAMKAKAKTLRAKVAAVKLLEPEPVVEELVVEVRKDRPLEGELMRLRRLNAAARRSMLVVLHNGTECELRRTYPTATIMVDWPSSSGLWTKRPPLRVGPGQTVAFAMRSSSASGGCEAKATYAAESSAANGVAAAAAVTIGWCNPPPQLVGSHGRWCETRTEGGLPLRVGHAGPSQKFESEVEFSIRPAPGMAGGSRYHPATGAVEDAAPVTKPELGSKAKADAKAADETEVAPVPDPEPGDIAAATVTWSAPKLADVATTVLLLGGRGLQSNSKFFVHRGPPV